MLYGIQVNLAAANTNYNLASLCQAIDARLTANIPLRQFHTIFLQTVGVAQAVLVGDSDLSATRYGYSIATTGTLELTNDFNVLPFTDIWLRTAGTNIKVNVLLIG